MSPRSCSAALRFSWSRRFACRVVYAAVVLLCVTVSGIAETEQDASGNLEEGAAAAVDGAASQSKENTHPSANTAILKPGVVTDAADLEAFFDGAICGQLESKHIAGGVVAVVADGKVVFIKGYGYADVEARQNVDPQKTLFRIGSTSKLFTWTAVMQQVEEGKLDLDNDVNAYLKNVKIPSTYPEPITLKSLLTHTSGFDDVVIGLFSRKSEAVAPLDEVLRAQMPTRVRPPGVLPCYSNHGTALAGYLVACASGIPWEDYIEQRILTPLGMEHTLVRQPAEDKLPAELSHGYKWEAGQFKPQSFEYIPAAPAGCISATAADAAKFMIAHLNDGQLGEARILKPETARRMREPLFRPDPKTDAICYGFMEMTQNGERVVGHDGATNWFHTLMELLPDRRVGVFISFNTDSASSANGPILTSFLDRYYPVASTPRPKAAAGFNDRAKRLAGEYIQTRYSHTSITKLAALIGVFMVTVNKDDTITIGIGDPAGRYTEGGRRYVEIEPLVFHEQDGHSRFVFQVGKNGRIAALYASDAPVFSALRSEWYESTKLHWGVLYGCAAVFASALLYWPVIAFSVGGWRAFTLRLADFRDILSVLAWLQSAASLGFVLGLTTVLSDPLEISFGISANLKALLLAPQVSAVLAALTLLGCVVAWFRGYWHLPARLHFTLVALAGIAFTWFLHYWNLLKFGF